MHLWHVVCVIGLHDWLAVVAKHVGFDECMKAAVESLSKGLQLASFGCTKCGATVRVCLS